ncbi:MAG: hypothetical protein PHS53_03150 [Candidatus Pacebacteria bacterium]|nr:hypothetical protein [Candidatus Paceibacterota bacterium]
MASTYFFLALVICFFFVWPAERKKKKQKREDARKRENARRRLREHRMSCDQCPDCGGGTVLLEYDGGAYCRSLEDEMFHLGCKECEKDFLLIVIRTSSVSIDASEDGDIFAV